MKTFTNLPQELINHIEQLERVRQDFVANVSHELRTPLTVIHGYLEALLANSDEQTNVPKSILEQLYQQTLRMENIVSDLLFLSKLEANKLDPNDEAMINVALLLANLSEIAKHISGDKNHKINMQLDKNLLLRGAEEELKSLFSNLIINAVKYTPANGIIKISWFNQNGQAVFQIKDTGIGIAEKHIPRITERFYRVDKARSRDSGGTGLGLAIVKHVLMRHDATLEVQSEVGTGSTFTCVFAKSRSHSKKSS